MKQPNAAFASGFSPGAIFVPPFLFAVDFF
jgi:hypothetical protein